MIEIKVTNDELISKLQPEPLNLMLDERVGELIQYYGKGSQLNMAVEEMSELTKEICKNKRGHENQGELICEIADVYLMLYQLMLIFEISQEKINDMVDFKLDRQINRMHSEIEEQAKRWTDS